MNYISFTVYGRALTRFTLLSKDEVVLSLNKNNIAFRDLLHKKCTLSQLDLFSSNILYVYPKSNRCKTKCRVRRYRTGNSINSFKTDYWRKANIIFFEEELLIFRNSMRNCI